MDLKEKLGDVPPENIQVPPIMIAGPVLEALRYAYDEEELREMYEKMLASAMDNRNVQKLHPSYVDAIRQMAPLDAHVLYRISQMNEITTKQIKFYKKGTKQWYINAMPYHFCEHLCDLGDCFQISSSISNLLRLGLLISVDGFLIEGASEKIKSNSYVQQRFQAYSKLEKGIEINVSESCYIISLDSYGRYFVEVCILRK